MARAKIFDCEVESKQSSPAESPKSVLMERSNTHQLGLDHPGRHGLKNTTTITLRGEERRGLGANDQKVSNRACVMKNG